MVVVVAVVNVVVDVVGAVMGRGVVVAAFGVVALVEHIDPDDPVNIWDVFAFEWSQAGPQSVRLKDVAP